MKIPMASAGFEPTNVGTKASMLTPIPPKPLRGAPTDRDTRLQSLSLGSPVKVPSLRVPASIDRETLLFQSTSLSVSQESPLKEPPSRFPNEAPMESAARFQNPSFTYLPGPPINNVSLYHFYLKDHQPRSVVPQRSLYEDGWSVSIANGLFVHSYPSRFSSPTKQGENIWSPPTKPHADGRPIYNRVRTCFPRGSFTTLLLLPQCHASSSMIPPTLV
jgi:hypothetical protein